MVLTDLSNSINPETIATQVAVMGATLVLMKQWLRSDIKNLGLRMGNLEQMLNTKASDDDLDRLEEDVHEAITRLATSVDTYVRTTMEERYRAAELINARDREIAVKVAALDAQVALMHVTLNRVSEQMTDMTGGGH